MQNRTRRYFLHISYDLNIQKCNSVSTCTEEFSDKN